MKGQNLFIFFLVGVALISCRKDEKIQPNATEDFRDNYVGQYELYVHSQHWQLGSDAYRLEDTIIGQVFKYDSTQSYSHVQNTFSPFNNQTETSSGLTIRFTDDYHSHCYVYEDDTIRSDSGYHYFHEGYFKGDSLYFNVTGLGGLGGGANYYTKGKKIQQKTKAIIQKLTRDCIATLPHGSLRVD